MVTNWIENWANYSHEASCSRGVVCAVYWDIWKKWGPALGFGLGWGAYAVATWEKDVDIAFAQDAIDEYKAREAAAAIQGKMVGMQHKKSKANLKKLDEQPGWLNGGQLRDY